MRTKVVVYELGLIVMEVSEGEVLQLTMGNTAALSNKAPKDER